MLKKAVPPLALVLVVAVVVAAAQAPHATAAVGSGQTYVVLNANSDKCVDSRGSSAANGNPVQQYTCNGTGAQRWTFTATDSGYFRIGLASSTGQVWDDTGASTANNALIQLYAYGGGTNQQWLPVQESNGNYHFVNRLSGKCLDTPGGSTADSVQLQQYTCNNLAPQSFTLAPVSGGLPCDIYVAGGTPCIGAHSTTRALFANYSGRLYQVRRVSDGATTDIGTLAAGGYANAAAQNSFCSGTTCTVTVIYDQTNRHNDLTIEHGGIGANGGNDIGALAHQLPVTAGGHSVYGVYVAAGVGYRHAAANGAAVNGQPESMYMVASGTHVNNGCCFDYGNAEVNVADTGNGHMDTVNLGTTCFFGPCSGSGPWVAADLENGLFQGNGSNTGDQTVNWNFTTAMDKNDGQTTFALHAGNANGGGLQTEYNGTLPTGSFSGYKPMHQEGSIVMGTGGDNSNWSVGSFFEGAMTYGYPSDATDAAVQANIVSVGYAGDTKGTRGGTITGPGGKCVDVAADDTGGFGAAVQLWDCQSYAVDQHWLHNGNNSLSTIGRCLDINGNGTANGTQVELWECNNVGGQVWVQQADGSLLNPQSGRCLDDPSGNTANGTRLQIYDCNGSAAQKFHLN
jgi:hypothetical protein